MGSTTSPVSNIKCFVEKRNELYITILENKKASYHILGGTDIESITLELMYSMKKEKISYQGSLSLKY